MPYYDHHRPNGHNGHGNGRDPRPEPSAQDLDIFERRLNGRGVHTIAKEMSLAVKEVDEAIDRCCRPVDEPFRLQTVCIELERLDRFTEAFYRKAINGDHASAAIVLKVNERRSAILGLDVPAGVRKDPVMLQIEQTPQPTTTDRIKAALDRIAAMRVEPKSIPGSSPSDPDEP
jgi:hypothetical protein